ncbi:LTA synthase family protein [Paenibacillus qinlingensis]|uniref:Phosphoglycerol transferase MdoB-like AlkP superfamily enzyme n=1 Tax=Paenibacillus qinlingensis TaxID=1837343 RepID=A0ABU1NUM6_9BACL|nr:LTA synthase family protein [Paenibacillus qinlingensis]MDR6551135.1 phosphoglycerol transferase MdoB-like AlkP superfamily enzyme [Paenibacillus qinlingensis]
MLQLSSYKRRGIRSTLQSFSRILVRNDKLSLYTFIAILWKSQLLLAALHAPENTGINIGDMYFTIPPVLSHLMFILFVVSIGLFFKKKGRRYYLVGIQVLFSLLLICDLVYYRAYGAFLSLRFLVHPNGFNPLDYNLWTFLRLFDLWFILDLVVIGGIALFRYNNMPIMSRRLERKRQPVLAITLMLLAAGVVSYEHYRIDVKDTTDGQMMFFNLSWAPFQSMSDMSPIGYHLYDGLRLFGSAKTIKLADQEHTQVQTWLASNEEGLPDNSYKGMFQGKNLIVIQVESLENFVIGEKVNGQEITPNINRLLGNSLYFNHFYEQVNNGTSSDSDLLTTTSVFPVRSGANFFRYPTNTYNSLPKLMEGMGYQTISTHSEPAGSWNWVEAHHNIGYQTSWDLRRYKVDDIVGLGLSDESYLRQLGDKLTDVQSPFMLHVITLSSHGPFDLPEKTRKLQLDPSLDKTIMGAYFQSINYTDKQIGAFLDKLDQLGLLDQSVVAIYGDHTGVHKYYQDQVDTIPSLENESWRTHSLQLPFIVYSKGIQGEQIPTIGGQIDTLPTLAYLMGVDKAKFEPTAMGKILVNTNRNFTILNNGTLVGEPRDAERAHIMQSFQIADWLHESNYFAE